MVLRLESLDSFTDQYGENEPIHPSLAFLKKRSDTLDQATNLHFRGARVFRAIIDNLLAKGMKNAKNVRSENFLLHYYTS